RYARPPRPIRGDVRRLGRKRGKRPGKQTIQRRGASMPPSVAELMNALPEEAEEAEAGEGPLPLPEPLAASALRPVPGARWRRRGWRRVRLLGTLEAKIGAAYLFYWIRGWFRKADERERLRAETHWRTAVRVLDSMSYLRGAVMKVGQTLANYPDIVPREFV